MSTVRRLVLALGLQTLAGLALWVIVAVVAANIDSAELDLVAVLLLFGQLVVVPLGLQLIPASGHRMADALMRGARFLLRIGGAAAIVSLAIPRGELSAAVAALYLLPALLVGVASILRAPAVRRPPDLATVAAGIFLAIGALFFVLYRQDVAIEAFPELTVQVTAVHLHFVGFGLLLVAGSLADRSARMGRSAVRLLMLGSVATPLGHFIHPVLEVAGAIGVTAGLLAVTGGTFPVLADRGVPAAARRLLFVSIVFSLFIGAVAVVYAAGEASGMPSVDIGSMVRLHGTFAAIGVVFCGLLGWRLVEAP